MIWIQLSACVFITEADIAARHTDPPIVDTDIPAVDSDGDGVSVPIDCDDTDPHIYPGAEELPNQVDDNCDGRVDEGTIFYDDDGDGFCEQLPCAAHCGRPQCDGDCDDTHATVYPGAPQRCDTLPNDCEFNGDEHDDRDGDGWSVADGDPNDLDITVVPTDVLQIQASITCDIVRVNAGTFTMGCEDPWCAFDEGPEHPVTLTHDLLVMETEVLRFQWDRFVGAKNWAFPDCGETCPVTRVSWVEALAFANTINDSVGLPRCEASDDPYTCKGWRLPTEAEWAYFARGTRSDRFSGGSNASLVGWVLDNSDQRVHPARLKLPTPDGLYDTTGNVWEWTWDAEALYPSFAVTDPVTLHANPPQHRVLRGASSLSASDDAHVTVRISSDPHNPNYLDSGNNTIDHSIHNPFNYHGVRLVRRAP